MMMNEIHPFEITIPVSEAIDLGILKIGKCDMRVYHTNSKEYRLIEILNKTESLCLGDGHIVYKNTQISIFRQVVLYDEVKGLKFIKQTNLFEDGKHD